MSVTVLLVSQLVVTAIVLVLTVVLLIRKTPIDWTRIEARLEALEKTQANVDRSLRDELSRNREEAAGNAKQAREELAGQLRAVGEAQQTQLSSFTKSLFERYTQHAMLQKQQLDTFSKQLVLLTGTNEQKLEQMRETLQVQLKSIQEDNSKKLEQIRVTVDEKLHETLEKRLGESFKQVSERLEEVHKGLGEMQNLATGVGDLKRVLTNVKSRGVWGEMQLGNIIAEIMTPDQYGTNVATKKGSGERVEFAVKLPGARDNQDEPVWLPIDAKFPQEDYQRLVDAYELADQAGIQTSLKQLGLRIKSEAQDICSKYIDPPGTTDFGIMFLPTEGLFAEVLRMPGLSDEIRRTWRVIIAGPTTLVAVLNSLGMGFRTLAIEKRSSEVWNLLGAVKTEFGKFGDLLDKTSKKLQEAGNQIDNAARKSRTIERKLRDVQELPAAEAAQLVGESVEDIDETN